MIAHITSIIKKGAAARGNILVLFVMLAVIALFPFLFGERLMLSADSDALYYYYPAFDFYGAALKAGESFLWNPYLFSGFPMYLSQSAGFLDPVNLLLFRFLPNFTAYHVRLALDVFLVMLFSYLAGRAYGLSRLASSLIGPSYLLAFHWRFLSNPVIANSLFLLPLLFFAYLKAREGAVIRWRWAVLGGIGAGWSFLAGYAQITIYSLFLLGLYALVDGLFRERRKDLRMWVGIISVLLIIAAAGFVIGLPQILPALKFTPLTIRAGGLDYGPATLKSVGPGDVILFFLPDYLYFPYLSAGRKPLFIGAFWFMMALSALVLFWRKREVRLFGSLFLFCFVASLAYSPLFYLMQQLPILKLFRFPFRWMYLGAWFLALLGAFGFDLMREYSASVKSKRVWISISCLIGLAAVGVLLFSVIQRVMITLSPWITEFFSSFGFTKGAPHYQDAIRRGLEALGETVSLGNWGFLIPFVSLLAAVGLTGAFIMKRVSVRSFRAFGAGLVLTTFLGIFLVQWGTSLPQASLASHGRLLESVIPPEDRILYRTYPFMISEGFTSRVPPKFTLTKGELLALTGLQLAAGSPNTHMYANVNSVDGYDPFLSREYLSRLTELGSLHGAEDTTRNLTQNERVERLYANLPLLGSMSGKYIISGVPLRHSKLVFLGSRIVSRYQIPLYLYQNIDARPRFYLLNSLDERQPKGKIVPVRPTKVENGYFEFEIEVSKSQRLIIIESNLPGWEARIDGKVANIFPAEWLYMAVEIPEGTHKVTFLYGGMMREERFLERLGLIRSHKP
ncbi:MAG: hypothetical protein HYT40_00055 [Candidatus Sungbacteria bacterium]|uniref:YfhO family protein n=1 Tax=Candidatus Sungiibacteriota bacterium TaxID=2750080 RepID=A0A931SCP2_9BACT|nr:hypothetical protein [Candidatus Sungbacteria bacterium]